MCRDKIENKGMLARPAEKKMQTPNMVEAWVDAHEEELLEQWENAFNNRPVKIVG